MKRRFSLKNMCLNTPNLLGDNLYYKDSTILRGVPMFWVSEKTTRYETHIRLYPKKEMCQIKKRMMTAQVFILRILKSVSSATIRDSDLSIPDFHAISQSLPRSPPTISYLFPLAYTHLRVAVDARTGRGALPPRLAQPPVARSAAE